MAPEVEMDDGTKEQWHDWFVPGGKAEFDPLPDKLKPLVRSLARRPESMINPGGLLDYYDRIDALTQDPQSGVGDADVAPYLARIATQTERLSKKEPVVLRELPLHIGAVFKGGRNIVAAEHASIPKLDIDNADHRQAYILENLHAFNELFRQPESWKGAVDIWLADARVAASEKGLANAELESFMTELKACMAVTASARAMEISAGVATTYLSTLTGGEKGNLDTQDTWSDYLLHADIKKLNDVLSNPLVAKYYEFLMADAGMVNDVSHRWSKNPEPPDKDRLRDLPSSLEFRAGVTPESLRSKSRLIGYLKDSAAKGGFNKYIEEVMLHSDNANKVQELANKGITEDSRWEAAKLACDAFLVDLWTRWEDKVTESGKVDLKLQPIGEWGGDPLKSFIKPSFLPRLKGVYTGNDEVILDMMDKAFRPDDILRGYHERWLKVPSMVTNLKTFGRYTTAVDTFLGGSMAVGIPSWDSETLGKGLPAIASLLEQVYGGLKSKRPNGSDDEWGRELVGAMVMRLLYTKALASATESARPDFADRMRILFPPDRDERNRPFFEVLTYLYGPNIDGKRGFVQSLIGGRTRLVIRGNRYGAEEAYRNTWAILQTNDQGVGYEEARALGVIGVGFDIARAYLKHFGEK